MAYKGMRWLKCDFQMQTPADAQHLAAEKMIHQLHGSPAGQETANEAVS